MGWRTRVDEPKRELAKMGGKVGNEIGFKEGKASIPFLDLGNIRPDSINLS